MKFSALLCPRFLRRCTFLEPHNLAPLFYIPDSETFPDILFADKHLTCPKCVLGKVWYYNILNETLKTWKANSHLPPRCPPHLRTNGQIFQVPNYPQPELQDQIKFPRISRLEYLRGHQKHTFSEAELPQPSRDEIGKIWIWLSLYFSCECATWDLKLNKNLTAMQAH